VCAKTSSCDSHQEEGRAEVCLWSECVGAVCMSSHLQVCMSSHRAWTEQLAGESLHTHLWQLMLSLQQEDACSQHTLSLSLSIGAILLMLADIFLFPKHSSKPFFSMGHVAWLGSLAWFTVDCSHHKLWVNQRTQPASLCCREG